MRSVLLVAALAIGGLGCHRKEPEPAAIDSEANAVRQIKERLDTNKPIPDSVNRTVRDICHHRSDLADCRSVLARLPPPWDPFTKKRTP